MLTEVKCALPFYFFSTLGSRKEKYEEEKIFSFVGEREKKRKYAKKMREREKEVSNYRSLM